MIQIILTLIIVFAAITVTIIRAARFFTEPSGHCKGCGHHDSGCSLEDLKIQIQAKKHATLIKS